MTTAALIAAGRRVVAKDLTWGTSGNLSARVDADRFVISATGVRLEDVTEDALVTCAVGADSWSGDRRPSVETGMHRAVFARRPDVGAVLHCSPFAATLMASSALPVDPYPTTDGVYYVGEVARVGFELPGSAALADAVAAAIADVDVLLLENHGALCVAPTLDEVVNRAEAFELLCRMLVAEAQGFPLRRLSPEDVARLRAQWAAREYQVPGTVYSRGRES